MNQMIGLREPSLTLMLLAATCAAAQITDAAPPTFEVASIHPHTPKAQEHNHIYSSPNDGNFRTINLPLKALIQYAFDIPQSRIVNAPDWTSSQSFDIDAKSDDATGQRLQNLPTDQAKPLKLAMIQALLADRFGLKTHREKREFPIFELVEAKTGSKLAPSKADGLYINHSFGYLNARGITLPLIAQELSRDAGRVIVDKTSITGRFDIDLHWQPDDGPPVRLNGQEVALPSLFTALQEELGLHLEARKGPVEVLVIDDVHQPSEN